MFLPINMKMYLVSQQFKDYNVLVSFASLESVIMFLPWTLLLKLVG